LYEPGQSVTAEEIEKLINHFQGLLSDISLILFCGSGQTDLLAPVYAKMIELARESKASTILDSSGEALRLGIDAKPDAVKVNRNELSDYFKRDLDTLDSQIEAMLELQQAGIEIVALSRGDQGLIATDGRQIWEGALQVDRIINVVGCGDSQLAGIAKQILEGASLQEIVRWGVACGTANTQVRGAGRIEIDTVNEMLPQVLLREVER
jgi:fructose-1-phosphate kinase PfkB-like protein